MGAWGSGPFENDGAGDLLASIGDGEFSFDSVAWAFEDGYLEVDGGQFALAMVELALVCLGRRPRPVHVVGVDLSAFQEALTEERLDWILSVAERTMSGSEASELYELWEETDDLLAWREPASLAIETLRAQRADPGGKLSV